MVLDRIEEFTHCRELTLSETAKTPQVEYSPGGVCSTVETCVLRTNGLKQSLAIHMAEKYAPG